MNLKVARQLIKGTYHDWSEDKAERLAAALAFYTVFSLAPLLFVVVSIAGLAFGKDAVSAQIATQIGGLAGSAGAELVGTMIKNAYRTSGEPATTLVGIITLLLGASGVFGQIQDAMNTIWEVKPKAGRGIMGLIKERFFSFTLLVGTGFLLLVSLILSTALSAFGDYLSHLFPGYGLLLQIVNLLISLAVSALVFVLIFKVIPDVKIAWSDVWIGAASTSVLFTLGRFLIGFYLGHSNVASVYGAAASLIILLTWIYYSANVLLLGAEFTQVYADQLGSRIVPKEGAAPMTSERRAQQGIDTEKSVKTSGIRTSKGHGEGTGKKHKRGLLMGILDRALDLYYIWKGRVGR